MGVTETSIALPAGGFWAARTARDIPHMRGYPVRRAAYPRHCEQSEAISPPQAALWIASLRSQ